jgi:4-amino-4-deoxy-L-arabinose transferase-like glycosyltransferase
MNLASMKRIEPSILLAAVILIAFLLRVWGINFDLPYIYHPDEPVPIAISQRMLKTGDLNPRFFHWPSLPIYLNLLAYVPYYLVGRLLGVFHSPNDILAPIELTMGVTYAPMPTVVLLGRLITVSFGLASVLLIYLIGERLSHRPVIGLLAALLVAVSPTNVWHSHWITPDTFATFFALTAVYASILILQEGKTWQYLVAGAGVGLAASSKYNAVLVIISLLLAHFFRTGRVGLRERNLYLALGLAGLAFLATTPFAVLDFPTFFTDLQFDSQHYATGHAGMEGDTLRWYLEYLWHTMGPLSLMAAVAILYGVFSRSKELVLLSAFPVVYFLFVSRFEVRNDRTLLPLTPFLLLLAAALLVFLVERAAELKSRRWASVSILALFAVLAVGLGISGLGIANLGAELHTVDSRETARSWIEANLPPGSRIALESYSPFVEPGHFAAQGVGRIIDHTPEWYVAQGFEYLVFSQGMFGRFYIEQKEYGAQVAAYEEFFEAFDLVRRFTDGGYEVRIYHIPQE